MGEIIFRLISKNKNYFSFKIICLAMFLFAGCSNAKLKELKVEKSRDINRVDTLYSLNGNEQIVCYRDGLIYSIQSFNHLDSSKSNINNGDIQFYENGFLKSLFFTVRSESMRVNDFIEYIEHSNFVYFDSSGYANQYYLLEK